MLPSPTPSAGDSLTDGSLVRRYRAGDEKAATAIYQRYASRLQGLARGQIGQLLSGRVDAEDIVQSAFKSFFRRARDGSYTAPDDGDLWNLLVVIAVRKVRRQGEFQRAKKRDVGRTVGDDSLGAQASPAEGPLRDMAIYIQETLESLSATDQEIVQLRMDGHLVGEIADQTQRSKRTVERVLQNVRDMLKDMLNEE